VFVVRAIYAPIPLCLCVIYPFLSPPPSFQVKHLQLAQAIAEQIGDRRMLEECAIYNAQIMFFQVRARV
jgi:hypothetical protein